MGYGTCILNLLFQKWVVRCYPVAAAAYYHVKGWRNHYAQFFLGRPVGCEKASTAQVALPGKTEIGNRGSQVQDSITRWKYHWHRWEMQLNMQMGNTSDHKECLARLRSETGVAYIASLVGNVGNVGNTSDHTDEKYIRSHRWEIHPFAQMRNTSDHKREPGKTELARDRSERGGSYKS